MTITDADIHAQVVTTLEASGDPALNDGIDVDGIVTEIINRFGRVDVDTIEHNEYWAIVQRHDSTQK